MTKHIHGGDVYKYRNCLDFSANLNPLGTPESVKKAICDSLDHIAEYPQVGSELLREKIAEYEGVKTEEVICGNGAAEVIFTLCRAVNPKKALIPAPTFAEYGQALSSTGCELEYYMLTENEGFMLGEAYLDILHKGLDMAFLCNPNNPTGMLIPHRLLKKILEKSRKLGILLVVDECFLDFVKEPQEYSLKRSLSGFDNLFTPWLEYVWVTAFVPIMFFWIRWNGMFSPGMFPQWLRQPVFRHFQKLNMWKKDASLFSGSHSG